MYNYTSGNGPLFYIKTFSYSNNYNKIWGHRFVISRVSRNNDLVKVVFWIPLNNFTTKVE
jgi:hypothetical protein